MNQPSPLVCVILVNWNGWKDTQRCLESLLAGDTQNFRVVICDNASSDGSLDKLEDWARSHNVASQRLSPDALSRLEVDGLESRLLLVPTGSNLGFAAACNIGLRHVLQNPAYSHAWLLNNDTMVSSTALGEMLAASENDPLDRPVGSEIYHLDKQDSLQVYGGQRLGHGPLISPRHCRKGDRIDFLVGSSIFVSRHRLAQLGLMYEAFFLNAEDLLYTLNYQREFRRAHNDTEPFLIAGRIWHQESSSQGRNHFLHSYYYSRNVLLVARDLGMASFGATTIHALLRIVKALCLLRFARARGIALGLLHAWHGRRGILNSPV